VNAVVFCKDINIDCRNGDVIITVHEDDPWHYERYVYITLERMQEIVAFAETVRRQHKYKIEE
jgi:hypothetical protein